MQLADTAIRGLCGQFCNSGWLRRYASDSYTALKLMAQELMSATDLAFTLLNTGAIRVTWTGTTANGTYYDVYRKLDDGEFVLLGSSPTRSYDDAAVPVGTVTAMYRCVARRDGFSSDASSPTLVRFGTQVQPGGSQSAGGQLGLAA